MTKKKKFFKIDFRFNFLFRKAIYLLNLFSQSRINNGFSPHLTSSKVKVKKYMSIHLVDNRLVDNSFCDAIVDQMSVGKTVFDQNTWNLFEAKTLVACGLYYKCVTIVIYAPSVVSKWCSKL